MPLSDDVRLRRAIFERARDAMLLVDDQARVLDLNPAACELFGRSREAMLGMDALALWSDGDRDRCARELEQPGAAPTEVMVRRPDGATRTVEVVITKDVLPRCDLLVARDRTEQRAREIDAERYRILWQRARDIVLFIDRDGRILEANDAAVEAYGRPREALLAMRISELRAPETRSDVRSQMDDAFTKGVLMETVHVRSDGTRLPVEVGSRAATIGGKTVLLSVIRDLTERREMQARLLHADRLATVGTLAAGLAHEINNPLTYVMASVEIALRMLREVSDAERSGPDGDTADRAALARATDALTTAMSGTERVRNIVRDLKLLARTDAEEADVIDVRDVLESCLDLAQHELRHRIHLVREYAEVPRVRANEARLAQVFLNLIVNAAHAVRAAARDRGTIRVATTLARDGRVEVTIADDGIGIDPEIRARIFDAFVTTKKAGEGTGLGLYLSRSIVHAAGGDIAVESEPGMGATFSVRLPRAPDLAPRSAPPPTTLTPRAARVMIVDDELAIGASLRAAFEGEHQVVVLTSAESAIEWLAKDAAFDAVISDVAMAGKTGFELLQHVREHHPALAARTILMSGGALPGGPEEGCEHEATVILEKPFSVDTLRDALARVLDASE
ncbi:MAG: PAS domain S-box protein [Myxococcota bacterium]|nr:PAS domain S-box protein [Myxococcota bacterium]